MIFLSMLGGRGRQLITDTFTSSGTWVAPQTTSVVDVLVGRGQNGTSDVTLLGQAPAAQVTYLASGTGTSPGSNTWGDLQGVANGLREIYNAGGDQSAYAANYVQYANGTTLTELGPYGFSNIVAGSAYLAYSGEWRSSGPIGPLSSSALAFVRFNYILQGASGDSSSAFGFTFSGGAVATAATAVTHTSISVTPGNIYSIIVPSGGSVQITYYR
jgi:hypothetical protein